MLLLLALVGCTEYGISPSGQPVDVPVETDVPETDEATDAPVTDEPVDEPQISEEPVDGPIATGLVYANTSEELFEVDPLTGVSTSRGLFHLASGTEIDGFVDIAIDLQGRMFGGTDGSLYRIDPATAEVSFVCSVAADMKALTFTDSGTLIAGGNSGVDVIDTVSCLDIELVDDSLYTTSGDLVGLPDGYLYWTVRGSGGDRLVRIDPHTGATLLIGEIGVGKLFGLGYHEDTLYGFASGGEIVSISPTTGAGTLLNSDDLSWWGATTNPVRW